MHTFHPSQKFEYETWARRRWSSCEGTMRWAHSHQNMLVSVTELPGAIGHVSLKMMSAALDSGSNLDHKYQQILTCGIR